MRYQCTDHPATTMQGCRRGVAPQWLTSMNQSSTSQRFSRTTRRHALSVQWCSLRRLKSTSGTMRKKKLTMRKAQAVPVMRLSGKRMSRGKQLISNSSSFFTSLMPSGSSSATTGAFLASSSKSSALSSPFFFASSCPSLYFCAPSSACGSSSFLTMRTITAIRKRSTIRKHRKTVPRWQFCPCELAIIQISLQSCQQVTLMPQQLEGKSHPRAFTPSIQPISKKEQVKQQIEADVLQHYHRPTYLLQTRICMQ